mgnify:FL=1
MEKYVVKKFVVRIMCILICIGITMSMPACSSESKNEKYTIYYTNSSKDKLIGSTCMLDVSMSVEDKVRTLLDNMGVRSSSKDEYIIKPDNVNLLESSVKGKTAFLNFTTTYKQMPSQVELLYRAAVVKTLTQLDDISYVHFYVDGKEALYEDGSVMGMFKNSDFTSSDNDIRQMDWRNVQLFYADESGTRLVLSLIHI